MNTFLFQRKDHKGDYIRISIFKINSDWFFSFYCSEISYILKDTSISYHTTTHADVAYYLSGFLNYRYIGEIK